MKPYAIGVDIGGTSVKIGLFSTDGTLLDKWSVPTRTQDAGEHILPDVVQSIANKLAEKGIDPHTVEGIGIGVPGPVDADFVVHKCVNLGWGVFNLKERMNSLYPEVSNIAAANDANVAALGELWQGGGKGRKSAVMFTLGTGVGGGVVVDGKIVAGATGGGGEVGHMTVEFEGAAPCTCGKRGCLEQYASANGIVRMAKSMLAACSTPSKLRSMEEFTSKDICDLAREGEEMAGLILGRCCDYLGRAMSYVANTTNPDVFIVGGGMSHAGDILTDTITKYFRTYAFHVCTDTPIVTACLGNDAGIYGCAKMILD